MKLVSMQKPDGLPMQRITLQGPETREGYAPNHVISGDMKADEAHIAITGPVTYSLEMSFDEARYLVTALIGILGMDVPEEAP